LIVGNALVELNNIKRANLVNPHENCEYTVLRELEIE